MDVGRFSKSIAIGMVLLLHNNHIPSHELLFSSHAIKLEIGSPKCFKTRCRDVLDVGSGKSSESFAIHQPLLAF